MYKIIGADGKEYGPVSAEQLRQWLTEGRVNQQTRVLAEGNTDWKAFGEVAELNPTTPPAAPPLSSIKFSPINSDQTGAREAVRGPAIFILVLSVLNIITSVVSCFWLAYESQFMTALGLPEQTNQIQTNMKIFFSVPATVIGFFLAVACLIGSLRMMKLQSHNFAIATAIMMLIPCSNCCCFLNIGAGIWALVVLQKPEVKSSFE
jgi:hypothetical protein